VSSLSSYDDVLLEEHGRTASSNVFGLRLEHAAGKSDGDAVRHSKRDETWAITYVTYANAKRKNIKLPVNRVLTSNSNVWKLESIFQSCRFSKHRLHLKL